MAHLAYKEKISKTRFENKIIADFGLEGLVCSPYIEHGRSGELPQRMHLYYKNNTHIGTHTKGTGWIFETAYEQFANV